MFTGGREANHQTLGAAIYASPTNDAKAARPWRSCCLNTSVTKAQKANAAKASSSEGVVVEALVLVDDDAGDADQGLGAGAGEGEGLHAFSCRGGGVLQHLRVLLCCACCGSERRAGLRVPVSDLSALVCGCSEMSCDPAMRH